MSIAARKIPLKSSDGETFHVNEEVALEMQIIKNTIDDCGDGCILLPNVTGMILAKIIEYCKKHVEEASSDLKAWDAEFLKVDQTTLFALTRAANYLDIPSLLELTCQRIADIIQDGKTTEK